MDQNCFNAPVPPPLTAIPIGVQGVAFDPIDLQEVCALKWGQELTVLRRKRPPGTHQDSKRNGKRTVNRVPASLAEVTVNFPR